MMLRITNVELGQCQILDVQRSRSVDRQCGLAKVRELLAWLNNIIFR